jgi:hypothetical protein
MTSLEREAGWDRDSMIEEALRQVEVGFGIVLVCHPTPDEDWPCSEGPGHRDKDTGQPCPTPGKRPKGLDWQHRAQRDPDRVRTMLGNPGNHSYGIMPPEGVFEWDVDGAAPARLKELTARYGPLPPTRVHRSGNGKHVFYRWPASVPGGSGDLFGITTRWPGRGMVVGPGCVHPSGRLYAVEADLPIAELPEPWARAAAPWSSADTAAKDGAERGDPDWTIRDGERHPWLRKQAARLRRTGLRGESLFAALWALNTERCEHPKGEGEIRALAEYFDAKDDDRGGGGFRFADESPEPEPDDPGPGYARAEPEPSIDGLAVASELREPEGVDAWQVEGIVRPRSLALFASSEGLGKSQMRREVAIRVATGRGAFLDTFPVPCALRVLALDLENGPEEEWRKEEAVLRKLGIERSELTNLVRGTVDVHLTQRDGVRRLRAMVAAHRPDLVLLDTGSAAVDEEYGKDLKEAIRNLTEVMAEFGCAFVVFVHIVKPLRDAKNAYPARALHEVMGNWPRRAASVVVLSDLGEDRILFQTFKRVPSRRLVLVRDDGVFRVVADLADGPVSSGSKNNPRRTTKDRVLEAIAGGLTNAADVADYVGVSPKTVLNHVTNLRAAGKVRGTEGAWEVVDEHE